MIKKIIYIYIWLLFAIIPLFSETTKNVLVLYSYKPNHSWTKSIEKGILETFNNSNLDINIIPEYMDIVDSDVTTQFNLLFDIYKFKYYKSDFDLIITTDNITLSFIKLFRDKLWIDVPIVFSGVDKYKPEMISNLTNITGITADVSIQETIDLILEQNSDINNVLLWGLNTNDINENLEFAEKLLRQQAPNINIIHGKGMNLTQGLKEYQNLKSNDIVLLFSVLKNENGQIIPPEETALLLSTMSDAPIYALHDIFLGYGILGGNLINSFVQGQLAAQSAIKILDGESIKNINLNLNISNQFMFDDTQLFRFKIPKTKVPTSSILINRRPSIIQRYKLEIRYITIFILILLISLATKFVFRSIAGNKREILLTSQRNALFNFSNDLLCITKEDHFVHLNRTWTTTLGWSEEELKQNLITHYVHPDDLFKTKEYLGLQVEKDRLKNFSIRYLSKDGRYITLSLDSYPMKEQNSIFIVAKDITTEIHIEEKINKLLSEDSKTGLPNHKNVIQFLKSEIYRCTRYKQELGLLIIDIDSFNEIIGKYGQATGDLMIKEVSQISNSKLRNTDKIGKYRENEFIIVLPGSNKETSMIVAERIRKAISLAEFPNDESVTVSIGCSIYEDDLNSEQIIERAKLALSKSKDSGRNHVSFK